MAGKCRIAGVSILCYFVLLLNSIDAQVTIITQPMNVTVCLSQTTTANFTCVVDAGSTLITSVGWQVLAGGMYVLVVGRARHMLDPRTSSTNRGTIVTETLTVTDVSLSDNGTKYRCEPVRDVISDVVTLTVIAASPDITDVEVNEICTNDFTVSWTPASNEEGLFYNVTLTLQSGVMFISDLTMDNSYNFTGLTPNTNYSVSIASVLNSCTGTPNTMLLTTVIVEARVPRSVSNLRSSGSSNNIITIVWDPADSPYCGPVLYYNVTIANSATPNDMNATKTSITRVEFSNLMNGTSYFFNVAAVNRAGTGPTSPTINVTTLADDKVPDNNGGGSSSGLSAGATAGIVVGVIVAVGVVITISIILFCLYQQSRNKDGILSNSPDPSPNMKKAASNEPKGKVTKPSKQKDKQANKTEYAELQLSSTGTAPSVDPTKVDYTVVKEHEPLSYVEVQHDKGAGEKPIQGAPQVEYKEVWHQ